MRYYLLVVLVVFGMIFSSCEDLLDMKPKNSLTFANAFETEQDIESGLRAVEEAARNMRKYSPVPPGNRGLLSDYHDISSPALLGDDMNAGMQSWNDEYRVMTYANTSLPYIDGVNMPQSQKDFYRGQIYFFRAFAYLDLIQSWGDCVLVKDEIDINPQTKTSWPIVAEYAIELARKATRLLPEYGKGVDSKGSTVVRKSVPAKGSAYAVLAYLAAWKAGCKYLARPEDRNYDEMEYWRLADSACTKVIESPVYQFARTPEEVCTDVLVGDSKESVYESSWRNYIGDNTEVFLTARHYQGWPIVLGQGAGAMKNRYYRILASTVYQMYPSEHLPSGDSIVDLRREAYFYKLDSMTHDTLFPITGGYAYPRKWRVAKVGDIGWGTDEFINYDQNKIWYRLTDLILLRAECRARLGNTEGAISDLNRIRNRARAKAYDPSEYGGDLRYAIYKERERELLMEDFRYWDIVRNGYVREELPGKHKTLTDQDMIDGALFNAVHGMEFSKNPKMTQNLYWKARE